MDKQVTQALNSLVPSLTGPLAPELVELASSLLAQSRSKVSILKAEEEIARSYACANIACERLKQSLALPKIEPRPPCPPRIYQKLYGYLKDALPAGKKGTRPLKRGNASYPTSASSKHVRPDKPAQNISLRRKTATSTAPKEEVATWVMSVIRHTCKDLSAPAAPHHIFAGVSSILSARNLERRAADINIPALIVVLYMFVVTRLTGVETEPTEFLHRRELAMASVNSQLADRSDSLQCKQEDVDLYMRQIGEQGWTRMDWFTNIEVGAGLSGESAKHGRQEDMDGDSDGQKTGEGHVAPPRSRDSISINSNDEDFLQAGVGTMMDASVDYLSDTRRRSYERWRTEMLLQIDELEAQKREAEADAG